MSSLKKQKKKKAFSSASMFREPFAAVNQPCGVRGEVRKGLEEVGGKGRKGFCD